MCIACFKIFKILLIMNVILYLGIFLHEQTQNICKCILTASSKFWYYNLRRLPFVIFVILSKYHIIEKDFFLPVASESIYLCLYLITFIIFKFHSQISTSSPIACNCGLWITQQLHTLVRTHVIYAQTHAHVTHYAHTLHTHTHTHTRMYTRPSAILTKLRKYTFLPFFWGA